MGKSRDGRGGAQYRVVANCSGSTVHVRESPSFPSRALEGIFVDREERVRVSELQLTNVMGADVVFMKLVDLPGWICDRMPVTGTLMFEEITPDQLDAEYAHNRQWQSPPRSTRPVPRWQEQQQQRYPRCTAGAASAERFIRARHVDPRSAAANECALGVARGHAGRGGGPR